MGWFWDILDLLNVLGYFFPRLPFKYRAPKCKGAVASSTNKRI